MRLMVVGSIARNLYIFGSERKHCVFTDNGPDSGPDADSFPTG